ncbi:MAG: hypothetical protein ACJZ9F_03670 [Rhodospirillaceae bacterium]|mgnify:CR=1 FL=1
MNLSHLMSDIWDGPLGELVENFRSELQSNDRLKWMLMGGAFVIYLSLVGFLIRQSNDARQDYIVGRNQFLRLGQQASEIGWLERATKAEDLVDTLDTQFWPGNTTGLVEAGFERWIRQNLDKYDTEVRQVLLTRGPAIDDEMDLIPGPLGSAVKIRAKVIGPLNEAGVIQFLNDAGNHTSWIIVERLIIRDGRQPRFELDMSTYALTSGSDQ